MRKSDGISIGTILDTRRIKNSGLYPVKICVIYKRVAKYYPIHIDLSKDDWNSIDLKDTVYDGEICKYIKNASTLL